MEFVVPGALAVGAPGADAVGAVVGDFLLPDSWLVERSPADC